MKVKKWAIRIGGLVLAFAVFCALGMFLKKCAGEKYVFSMKLSEAVTQVNGDLSKQFIPKRLIQPGVLDFTSGHRGGIVNDTGKPLSLRAELVDLPFAVELKSSTRGFDPSTGMYKQPVVDGDEVSLEALVNIPRGELADAVGKSVTVQFSDAETGEPVAQLMLNITNGGK